MDRFLICETILASIPSELSSPGHGLVVVRFQAQLRQITANLSRPAIDFIIPLIRIHAIFFIAKENSVFW